jgi:hypothetical protein
MVVLATACRIGFDAQPGAVDDDADPLAPDANGLVDAADIDAVQADADPDAAPATATVSRAGVHTPASASDLISIDPVLLTESFVTCSRRSTSSNPNLNLARCQLLDGSTLRIESSALDSSAVTSWTVLQVPGAVVQRGTESFGMNDLTRDVTISSVDTARSFALVTTSSPMTGVDDDERTNVMIELASGTTVRLTRGSTGEAVTIDYQVIQLPSATVQFGTTTLDNEVTVNTSPVANLDLSRSFLVHSVSIDPDADGAEAVYMTVASLSATDVSFSRIVGGEPVQVSWFAVELPVTSSVKTQSVSSAPPHDQLIFDFNDDAITAGSFAFTSVEIDSGTLRTSLNAASFTAVVTDGNVRVERSVSDGSEVFLRTTVVDVVMP